MTGGRCATVHPQRPEVACTQLGSPHADHLAVVHVEGRSRPDYVSWPNEAYRSPEELKAEHRRVGVQVEVGARTVRAGLPQPSLQMTPQQRKKSRLGQVADLFLNNVGVWIPGHRLETQEIGGSSGLRRVRELRDDYHWPIENRSTGVGTDQYRLAEIPDEFRDDLPEGAP